jgi:hypothetical protein
MLCSQMKEGLTSQVSLPEASEAMIHQLLEYLYKGSVSVAIEDVFGLFNLACFIGCSQLKKDIVDQKGIWVTCSNTFHHALALGLLYEEKALIDEAHEFLRQNALFLANDLKWLEDVIPKAFDSILEDIDYLAVWDTDYFNIVNLWKKSHPSDDLSTSTSFNSAFMNMVSTRSWTSQQIDLFIPFFNKDEAFIVKSAWLKDSPKKREVIVIESSDSDPDIKEAKKRSLCQSDSYSE